jgi:hypothetical protein
MRRGAPGTSPSTSGRPPSCCPSPRPTSSRRCGSRGRTACAWLGAGSLGDLSDAILLRTKRLRGVTVNPHRRRARVEAGVLWQEASDAAAEHGLAALAGCSHDVGVLGYTLG